MVSWIQILYEYYGAYQSNSEKGKSPQYTMKKQQLGKQGLTSKTAINLACFRITQRRSVKDTSYTKLSPKSWNSLYTNIQMKVEVWNGNTVFPFKEKTRLFIDRNNIDFEITIAQNTTLKTNKKATQLP